MAVHPATDAAARPDVAVTIADNGSGMDRVMYQRLFHPFVTTKGEAGTGLGLWVSKGILDKQGARIAVRTRHGYWNNLPHLLPDDRRTRPRLAGVIATLSPALP